ncbi:MAG: hypothetical protein ACRDNZ_19115 [Streptosporangiaceae bacterium]
MTGVTRIPRSRGSLSGVLLILLGGWGALVPFIGPYFQFAYTPDKTWAYTSGRLYLSIAPGAAALLGGLLAAATRNRAVGIIGGLLTAAGGAWFLVGAGIVNIVLARPSISAGTPVQHSAIVQYLETIGFFTGVGIVILVFAGLVIGRFSMVSARDVTDDDAAGYDDDYLDPADQYPDQYPSQYQNPAQPTVAAEQFPSPTGQFPVSGTTQFPRPAPRFGPDADDPE